MSARRSPRPKHRGKTRAQAPSLKRSAKASKDKTKAKAKPQTKPKGAKKVATARQPSGPPPTAKRPTERPPSAQPRDLVSAPRPVPAHEQETEGEAGLPEIPLVPLTPAEQAAKTASDARWEATVEGQELFREGRLEASIGALTSVLRADPRNDYAAFFLGSALHTRGNLEAARAAFQTAIDVSPGFLGAWVGLGHLLLDAGENHAAVDCAKAILRLRAEDEDGNFLLGLGSARLGRYALSAAAFERVLAGRPSLELRGETMRLLEIVKMQALSEPAPGDERPS